MALEYKNNKYLPSWSWIVIYIIIWIILDQLFLKAGWSSMRMWFTRIALITLIVLFFNKSFPSFLYLWNSKGSGFNLAVWRILFFGSFLCMSLFFSIEHIKIALFSMAQMPDSARVPLPFWGQLTYIIPVNPRAALIAFYCMLISCSMAFIGFKTRWAILLFTLSAFYLFGISQLFGKVNHNHYFVWFPAILAFSGCGDMLSVDSLLNNQSQNAILNLRSGTNYGKAIVTTWILIGIIYFFPGFQKIWESGLDWILTDNLANTINHKLLELSGWKQLIPLQNYFWLSKLMAAFTIVFELGFIFAILTPKYRWKAIIAGIIFHIGTWLVMGIFFQFMIISYLSFINWEKRLLRHTKTVTLDAPIKTSNALHLTAIFLLLINIYCGFLNIHSWPVSCFPAFSSMHGNTAETLEFIELSKENTPTKVPLERFHQLFPEERFRNMELRAIQLAKENKTKELQELIGSFIYKLALKNTVYIYIVKITWNNGKTIQQKDKKPILQLSL